MALSKVKPRANAGLHPIFHHMSWINPGMEGEIIDIFFYYESVTVIDYCEFVTTRKQEVVGGRGFVFRRQRVRVIVQCYSIIDGTFQLIESEEFSTDQGVGNLPRAS